MGGGCVGEVGRCGGRVWVRWDSVGRRVCG